MMLSVNGAAHELPAGAALPDLLAQAGHRADGEKGAGRGLAIAVNGEVVPRAEWSDHRLADGDTVELLVAVQGG